MEQVAEILVNISAKTIDKPFSYKIPKGMDYLEAGWRVVVPFGGRKLEGFIVGIHENRDETDLKAIVDILDDMPWFDEKMLELAKWISEYYLCNLVDAMRLFIPGKSAVKSVSLYRPADDTGRPVFQCTDEEADKILETLRMRGSLTAAQIQKQFGGNVHKILRFLERNHLIVREAIVKKVANPLYKKRIKLAVPQETIDAFIAANGRKKAQIRLLEELVRRSTIAYEELKKMGITAEPVKNLLTAGMICVELERTIRDSYFDLKLSAGTITLSEQQQAALDRIMPALQNGNGESFLLHGITGSGKTQVYIEAAAKVREMGRQVIVLVPEIALTGQIVARFKARFGEDVVVLHSKLSPGERLDAWQRLRMKQAGIAIGARSAIFAPLADAGLMIIDEEHEFTYKQEETPRYHVKEVALAKAQIYKAVVVFGSATPSIETYYEALKEKHCLLSIKERIDHAKLPEVTVVDMRDELHKGRRGVISHPLGQLLTETLNRREQAIILLNRRGYSTFVMCRDCGYIVRCKHCDVSMVYHSVGNRLKCHYCQCEEESPDICPSCGSRYIRYFGTGTQKLEEELKRHFPGARIVRMDQDTTGGKLSHDRILTAFARGEYDILLGTQMVAKGHDIKNVTAVGIIAADSILNLPDFRAAERAFSLLTQASGRAGRGDKEGRVIVQTYTPEHYAVRAGSGHDYLSFYQEEIGHRQSLLYPPFSRMIKITVQSDTEAKAENRAQAIFADLNKRMADYGATEILGPFWSSIAKIKNIFRMNILIKTQEMEKVKAVMASMNLKHCPEVILDVEPLNLM
jgi:primosomal protein N' (replication factor Y)